MDVEVRLFATLKDRAGRNQIQVHLEQPATVATLAEAIAAAYPTLAAALPTALIAVNKAYAGRETPIQPGDEIAIFPPVSGGRN